MSDSNMIVMLESRVQELQTEVNRLSAENRRLVGEQVRRRPCGEAVLQAIYIPCLIFVWPFVCLWQQVRSRLDV